MILLQKTEHDEDAYAVVVEPKKPPKVTTIEHLLESAEEEQGMFWVHLRLGAPRTHEILDKLELDPLSREGIVSEEVRPQCLVRGEGALLTLFGFKEVPAIGASELSSLRLWVSAKKVITVWDQPLGVVRALREDLELGAKLDGADDLVAQLAMNLTDRAEEFVEILSDEIDELEDMVLEQDNPPWESELAQVRRKATIIRRSMFIQRDALRTFEIEEFKWVGHHARTLLREAGDRFVRIGEEMDAIRERAEIVHDQLMYKRAENTNRYMLTLAIIASIFLPLGLITGLLGINVGGIPGANSSYGFITVCVILAVLAVIQYWIIKYLKIF
ncbi:CorA family divalent cation transporter [Flexibacterium corallicola]|uniref:CorA family divalent cation transporter n=1 Tax=Flexibacterium corallicola TaxID=3037259 RepID=UPI00286F8DFA|nr:CorA family divalent cation transporter [Pseudovibrio sp. M1P-2-3]